MADERLRLVAEFQNKASAGVRQLSKDLADVKPNVGMIAARRWMDDFRAAGQKAAEITRPLSGSLSALGVGGVAAGLSLGEMVKQFRELATEIPRLRELGRESGLTETEIKRLQYAARMLNVDGDKMGSAIGNWSSRMVEFRRHTGSLYTEMLRQNSDLAKKISTEGPAEGFRDMLGWIARIPEAAKKAGYSAADAVQIQKRYLEEATGSDDLMPMLARGAQGLADAYGEAVKNVEPITPELVKQADALNQSLARFDQTWANFKAEVGPTVLNGLSETVDKLDRVFKLVQAHPTETAIAGGGAAAMFARNRIMARSSTSGLRDAATRHIEAAAALKGSAASLAEAARVGGVKGGGLPPGGEGAEPGQQGKVPSLGARIAGFAFGLAGIVANAPSADSSGDAERQANHDAVESFGETLQNALRLPQLRERLLGSGFVPERDDRANRARVADMPGARALLTDGNALRRGDEMPAQAIVETRRVWDAITRGLKALNPITGAAAAEASRVGHALSDDRTKEDVTEAVKTGTLAAWREMAQQQGLAGDMGVGAPSLRYGRGGDGQYRRGGHSGGGGNYPDTPDGAGHGERIQGGAGTRAMAAMKYLIEKRGWTPAGAAIAVGNAMQESQVSPFANGDPSVPGGSHHMFQWNRERLAAFRSYAAAHNKSVLDFETNLAFFDEERKRRSGLEAQWDKQKDLKNAGRLGHLYEGYGDNSGPRRDQNARDLLDLWQQQHPREHSSALTPNLVSMAGGGLPAVAQRVEGELHVHLHEGRIRRTEARSHGGLKLNIRSNPTMVETRYA